MTKKDYANHVIVLEGLKSLYKHELDDFGTEIYLSAISEFSGQEVRAAAAKATKASKFFPTPSVLIEHMQLGKKTELESNARLQAAWVRSQLDSREKHPDWNDKITSHVMRLIMPYRDWLGREQDDMDRFFQAQFVKSYLAAAKNPHERKKAEQQKLTSGEKKKPADPEVVKDNKAFLKLMELHNTWRFMRWPTGNEADEGAEGFYYDRYAKPLSFGDTDLQSKFLALERDKRFMRAHPGWVFDLKAEPRQTNAEKGITVAGMIDKLEGQLVVKNYKRQIKPLSGVKCQFGAAG